MLTLGRLAALTASVEHSTEQRESERRLCRTGRADPRAARERDPAPLRRRPRARLRARPLGRGAAPLPGGAALGRRRPAPRADPAGGEPAGARPARASTRSLARLLERRPELRLEWEEGVEVPPTSSRSPSRSWPRRCATPTATPSRAGSRSASPPTARPSASRWRTTAPATAETTKGGGLGLRLAALEALRYEGLVEFGAAARRPLAGAPGRPGGCLMASRGRNAAGARRRRPRRRPVGLPAAARAPELGRALPRRLRRRRGGRRLPPPAARGGAGRHAARQRVRGRGLRGDPRGQPPDPGAADLRRRRDLARRRPLGRRLRLHLQGLVGGRRRQGGADGLARAPRSSPTTPRSTRRSPSASRRSSR